MAAARKLPTAIRLMVAVAAAGVTLGAQARLPAASPGDAPSAVLPDPAVARVASLGFESLVSDYYWLRAVQLVGGTAGNTGAHAPEIGRLTELVVALDPWVDHPYRFAALWISEDDQTLDAANRILERGIAYHPADWRNRFYLSFNHLFYRGDNAAAERELEGAIGLEGAPGFLGRLLARLRSTTGDLDAAEAYLRVLRDQAPEGWRRASYEQALREVETERRARVLDEARARFQRENGFDVQRIEDLAWGPHAVLWTLPGEPNGAEWKIDEATDRIVSTYYGRRYQLYFQKGEGPAADPTRKRGEQG